MSKGPLSAMKTVYIGIGSNVGDKLNNCRKAIDMINNKENITVKGKSHFYWTEPIGVTSQDWYVNGAIRIETALRPLDLLRTVLSIESEMGRVRRRKWEPRVIDLDILLYEDKVIQGNDLTVPHPLMHTRKFVLMPMAQLSPDVIHPVLGKSMVQLLEELAGEGQGIRLLGEI
ncbi:MAG: 2-amino-4-hydroxy-6-hydroxymethyldihydropteridine diphosphokinase [Deltaproteobacteria bacterium]|nr:2-amino-4-hydroxy-6-hydroxymethyldihydropteridine diphosphokinase [Deltaproteobacteria bacterium]